MMLSRTLIAVSLIPALILLWMASPPDVRAQDSSEPIPVGDPIRGERIALSCSRCHGENGISSAAWIPSLAGLDKRVIYKQLEDYRSHRRRPEWYMASIAQALSRQDSADVSAYYERQAKGFAKPTLSGAAPSGAGSCGTCHNSRTGRAPQIAGQQQQYLEIQLSLFAQGIRSNDPDAVMQKIAGQLTLDQIRQISEYLGKPSR